MHTREKQRYIRFSLLLLWIIPIWMGMKRSRVLYIYWGNKNNWNQLLKKKPRHKRRAELKSWRSDGNSTSNNVRDPGYEVELESKKEIYHQYSNRAKIDQINRELLELLLNPRSISLETLDGCHLSFDTSILTIPF